MLNSITKDRGKADGSNEIPDPWDVTIPVSRDIHPLATEFSREEPPLITSAGKPNVLLIAPPKPHPEQTLLQDWLKLKTGQAKKFAGEIQQALGLLYWMEGIG
jgi:hypothetical protein